MVARKTKLRCQVKLLTWLTVFSGWKVSTRSLLVTLQDQTIGMLSYCGLRYCIDMVAWGCVWRFCRGWDRKQAPSEEQNREEREWDLGFFFCFLFTPFYGSPGRTYTEKFATLPTQMSLRCDDLRPFFLA